MRNKLPIITSSIRDEPISGARRWCFRMAISCGFISLKCVSQADGTYKILKSINDNAYKVELLSHYNVSLICPRFFLSWIIHWTRYNDADRPPDSNTGPNPVWPDKRPVWRWLSSRMPILVYYYLALSISFKYIVSLVPTLEGLFWFIYFVFILVWATVFFIENFCE